MNFGQEKLSKEAIEKMQVETFIVQMTAQLNAALDLNNPLLDVLVIPAMDRDIERAMVRHFELEDKIN